MKQDKTMIEGIIRILASTLVLRCKARFFAWSVGQDADPKARDFFYKDYDMLDRLCDELARRISQIGGRVPGAYSTLAAISSIKETETRPVPQMIQQLAVDHEQMVFDAQFLVSILQTQDDTVSIDLLLRSMDEHKSCAEKLRAFGV